MSTVQVEYIGAKPIKQDNVANTGTTWLGQGDVQSVPTNAWPLLARHPDVWRLAGDGQGKVVNVAPPAPSPAPQAPPAPAPAPAASEIGIYGTNHPDQIQVGDQLLQLGDVVAAAQARSGLNVDDWNALEDADRFDFVEEHIAVLRSEDAKRRETPAGTVTPPAPAPAPTPAPAPAPAPTEPPAPAHSPAPKATRKTAAPAKRGKRGS